MSVLLPAGWVPGSGWVSPTNCRACRCSFLLGAFQIRGGSAPRPAAHVGAPSCWVGSRFGVGQPHELPRMSVVLPAGWVPGSGWVSPTNCRACRWSFLLGGFQVRGGSAPRTAAHVGGPSCWVGSRFGVGQPHELPRMSVVLPAGWVPGSRSDAHTSELQSPYEIV